MQQLEWPGWIWQRASSGPRCDRLCPKAQCAQQRFVEDERGRSEYHQPDEKNPDGWIGFPESPFHERAHSLKGKTVIVVLKSSLSAPT